MNPTADTFIILGIIIAMVVFLGFLFGLAVYVVCRAAEEAVNRERDQHLNP